MKKFIFTVVCISVAIVYICKTEGRGKYIPSWAESFSIGLHNAVANYFKNLQSDGSLVITYRSHRDLLSQLKRLPAGEYKSIKIQSDGPIRIDTGVRCGDTAGLRRFEARQKILLDEINREIKRVTGSSALKITM